MRQAGAPEVDALREEPMPDHAGDAAFAVRLAKTAARVETQLETLLGATPRPGEIARPERLMAAMRHVALGGGKRLRPFLLTEAARLFGRDDDGPLAAGCALELVHCYSLAHDDLPAMDDDDLRRGRPTAHRAFDEATAILAGDALLTLAFDVMAEDVVDPDPAIRLALCRDLARAAGVGGMAGGQMLDLAAEGRFEAGAPQPVAEAGVMRLQAMKTGALILFAVEAGARLGRAADAKAAALSAYGRAVGAAFQVADDILDAESDAAALGKATGKDAGRGKATLAAALGLDGAKTRLSRLVAEAIAALEAFGPEADVLRETARFTAARRS